MAYKKIIRSERACSLSRYLMNLVNEAQTHALQWMEKTLMIQQSEG